MPFDPLLAEVRFGCGRNPLIVPPKNLAEIIRRLTGPDTAAQAYPIARFTDLQARVALNKKLSQTEKMDKSAAKSAARDQRRLRQDTRRDEMLWMAQGLLRRVTTGDGFRERLTAFWADHFTVVGKGGILRYGAAPYVEETIRPYVGARFGDMLRAVARAPMMLFYLDQVRSSGPNSGTGRNRGINENLAREMLELHTLGTQGPYDQADVSALALLLTGLSYSVEKGFVFRPAMAEPGPEIVLGVSYGDGEASLADIDAALEDLALHPSTALHLARKLAVHFVSDQPAPALVDAMTDAYLATHGDLIALYRAMLDHPAAWVQISQADHSGAGAGQGGVAGNVKQPVDFIGSALRALNISDLPLRQNDRLNMLFRQPLALMGQPWTRPEGPDGWPEADEDWITPQRLAGRLQWALNVPRVLMDRLPDPRDFVHQALAGPVPEALLFAAGAAQTRAEGVALVLASPAFQRM